MTNGKEASLNLRHRVSHYQHFLRSATNLKKRRPSQNPHITLIRSLQHIHQNGRQSRHQPLLKHRPHRARIPPRLRCRQPATIPIDNGPASRENDLRTELTTSNILQQPGGIPSKYIDPQYAQGNPHYADPMPTAIAQAAQDPNNPANPKHPSVRQHVQRKHGDLYANGRK